VPRKVVTFIVTHRRSPMGVSGLFVELCGPLVRLVWHVAPSPRSFAVRRADYIYGMPGPYVFERIPSAAFNKKRRSKPRRLRPP
jgi:hypothetical protein